jgi:GMP synthase (glutamine-hydrolysing)
MKKMAVVIQHVPHEGLGTLAWELKKSGIEPIYIKLYKGDAVMGSVPEGSTLIVMGGPMGVYEEDKYPFIKDELRLLEWAFKNNVPTLGICLGAQLMARAAGGRVYRGKTKEIGWHRIRLSAEGRRDALFSGFPEEFTVFQWHGDTFDLPAGATLLASSNAFPNQLIRVGRNAYGFQFHLEVTQKMIREWLMENAEELKTLEEMVDPARIEEETPLNISVLNKYGEVVFSRFFRFFS